jgi:hypothetical protein
VCRLPGLGFAYEIRRRSRPIILDVRWIHAFQRDRECRLFAAIAPYGCRHEYALYAASRTVALPLTVLYAMALRSHGGIAMLAVAMILVQLFDGIVGLRLHDPGRAYGPMVFAAINFGLLSWMNRTVATQHSGSRL